MRALQVELKPLKKLLDVREGRVATSRANEAKGEEEAKGGFMGIAKNLGNSLTNSVTAVTKPSWAQCFPGTLPHARVDILFHFATQHKTATRGLCQPPERSVFCCSCERGACVRVCVRVA